MSTVKEEVRAGRPGTGQEAQRTDAIRHKSGGRRSTSLTAGGERGEWGCSGLDGTLETDFRDIGEVETTGESHSCLDFHPQLYLQSWSMLLTDAEMEDPS